MGRGRTMSPPIERFRQWWAEARAGRELAEACCLSTIGLDGWPNARFVALKEVTSQGFVVAGPLDSRKGQELERENRAALTFWWPEVLRQVRVQGDAHPITGEAADRIFAQRDRNAQLLAWASRQGQPLTDRWDLEARIKEFEQRFGDTPVPRPSSWGGYCVAPIRVEFLEFRQDRTHERVEFRLQDGVWADILLQP